MHFWNTLLHHFHQHKLPVVLGTGHQWKPENEGASVACETKIADSCTEIADSCTEIADSCTEIADSWTEIAVSCSEIAVSCTEIAVSCVGFRRAAYR
eukprot:2166089-Rhodomonas_salina.1